MQKRIANLVLSKLDHIAGELQALKDKGGVDPAAADSIISNIDSFADKFEVAAFGKENLEKRMAKVLQQDSDEPYMKTFENPNKVLQSDADEPYMHKSPASFNSKGIDNYDQDRTVTVTDRDEYQVRDLSEHADSTKRQPSWSHGPAGKSTRQGSQAEKPEKQWA